jgi:hypothetical protein
MARRIDRFVDYERSVFVNCPFDRRYKPLFDGVVFAIIDCGFKARCALEIDDASQVRIDKIFRIIEECRCGFHDLTRTELDDLSRLPRFNMPLELGIFLGAKRFGNPLQRKKVCIILDKEPYRYQKFISDIAGQDIRQHGSNEKAAISVTRDWLRNASGRAMPGGAEIHRRYRRFSAQLPALCRKLQLEPAEATFNDYTNIVAEWLNDEVTAR